MNAPGDGERPHDDDLDVLARHFLESTGADPAEVVLPRTDDALWTQVETLFALEPELDTDQLMAGADVTVAEVHEITRALGLPGAARPGPQYTTGDVELVRAARDIVRTFPDPENGLRLLRVIATSLARTAEAGVAAYIAAVERPLFDKRVTRLRHARSQAAAVGNIQRFGDQLGTLLVHHTAAAVKRARASRMQAADFETSLMAVGFIDLVGFTPMSHSLSSSELASVVSDFEGLAFEIAVEHGGMVVKHVGDEVMFVAIDPVAACEIAVSLVARAQDTDGAITPHAGLAFGDLISTGGDYYGVDVNLAARLADVAVPREVLVSVELARQALKRSETFTFEPAGRRALKGFPEPIEVLSLARA